MVADEARGYMVFGGGVQDLSEVDLTGRTGAWERFI